MSIHSQLIKGFQQYRRALEISDQARVLFLYKLPASGFQEKGAVTDYFFFEQAEDENGKNVAWLKILNTEACRTLLETSNYIVFQNLNPAIDDLLFMVNKQFEIPSSFLTLRRRIDPTGNKYNPPPAP